MRKSAQKRERKLNWLLTQLIASAAIFLLVFWGAVWCPNMSFDVFGLVRQVISGDQSLGQIGGGSGRGGQRRGELAQSGAGLVCGHLLPTGIEEPTPEDSAAWLDAANQFHLHLAPL